MEIVFVYRGFVCFVVGWGLTWWFSGCFSGFIFRWFCVGGDVLQGGVEWGGGVGYAMGAGVDGVLYFGAG
jgi:hypothetical protein